MSACLQPKSGIDDKKYATSPRYLFDFRLTGRQRQGNDTIYLR
ncbi:MAG: hypothetical protein ACI9KE_005700, partial [Polyangiales bacterium]